MTSFELISDQAAEQSAANQLHILQTLQAILLSDELGIEQERVGEHYIACNVQTFHRVYNCAVLPI